MCIPVCLCARLDALCTDFTLTVYLGLTSARRPQFMLGASAVSGATAAGFRQNLRSNVLSLKPIRVRDMATRLPRSH